jgi:hypothetical protein
MCWACSWNGGIEECTQNFNWILLGKFPLESLRRTLEEGGGGRKKKEGGS